MECNKQFKINALWIMLNNISDPTLLGYRVFRGIVRVNKD
jgi:hypothetical protein